jgi:hypothetical protein
LESGPEQFVHREFSPIRGMPERSASEYGPDAPLLTAIVCKPTIQEWRLSTADFLPENFRQDREMHRLRRQKPISKMQVTYENSP